MRLLKDSRFRVLIYIVLFLAFYMFSLFADISLYMCPINELLGIVCPGCGTTRAFLSILKLDFNTALHLNPLFVLFVFSATTGE